MRRLLVAGIAALAVVLGLVVSTGTAFATDPPNNDGSGGVVGGVGNAVGGLVSGVTGTTGAAGTVGVSGSVTVSGGATPSALPCAPVGGVRPAGCDGQHHPTGPGRPGFPGGPRGGSWHPGAPWGGPTLYGHQLWLNAQLGLDICGYGNSYDTFLNRNLSHRSDIDRYLGRGRWQSLYSSDCNSSLAVVPGGLTLVNGNLINLDLLGLQGAGTVNVCSYPDYNVFNDRLGNRFGSRWGGVRNRFGSNGFNVYRQLRVNAHCTTIVMPSSTTIVQQPQQTLQAEAPAADPSGNDAASAPAPLASGPLPAIAPAKAPNEGGFDLAYVLAHARVA
jgi:hypothetical protein